MIRTVIVFLMFFLCNSETYSQTECVDLGAPNGLRGGNLIIHPNNKIYVQSDFNGIFESIDMGKSWEWYAHTPCESCGDLAVDSLGNFYLPVKDYRLESLASADMCSGLLVSKDCRSWKFKRSPLNNGNINDIEVFHDSLIVVTTQNGVYYVEDEGSSWIEAGLQGKAPKIIKVFNESELFVTVDYDGIYHQPRYGVNWQLIDTPNSRVEDFVVISNEELIVALWDIVNFCGVISTYDRGRSWFYLENGLKAIRDVRFEKNGDEILLGRSDGEIYKLLNNYWIETAEGLTTASVRCFREMKNGEYIATTLGGGILITQNNKREWKLSNDGLPKLPANCIYINDDGSIIAGFSEFGAFKFSESSGEWEAFSKGLTQAKVYSFYELGKGEILAGTYHRYLYRLKDESDNWEIATKTDNQYFINEMFDMGNNRIGAVVGGVLTKGGLYISDDEGRSWGKTDYNFYWPHTGAIDSNGVVYIGARHLYRSVDGGFNFEEISRTDWDIEDLCIGTEGELYVGISSGEIRMSYDGGNTFESRERIGARVVEFVVCNDGRVIAGTLGNGIFITDDHGYTWSKLDLPINQEIVELTLKENILYICSAEGVYRVSVDNQTRIEENETPQDISLISNYPNPFNASTMINYIIPQNSIDRNNHVTLKVFDINGREVTTLVNENQLSGKYQIYWNPTDCSSGVYFANLNVNGRMRTIKLILLK